MLQRYDISIDGKVNSLSIKEFAVLGPISRHREYFEPTREKYFFLHGVTYDSDTIRASIEKGKEALISKLRSDGFFPVRSCAEVIAGKVIELFDKDSDGSAELFFDDHSLFAEEG